MTSALKLDQAAIGRILLAVQGLLSPPRKTATRADVFACIRRMGALQIDTINVVSRSPYFVLWSRLGRYDPRWLDQLLAEGNVFEYWSHAACFLPIEDYPLYRPAMETGHPRHRAWLERNPDIAKQVLDRVRERGEIKSADFKRVEGKAGGWWSWKPEKLALECLLTTGQLMVSRRDAFQRVYALPEQVLGDRALERVSAEQARRALAVKSIRALGVAPPEWVADYFRLKKAGIATLLEAAASTGELLRVEVEGWNRPAYLHPDNLDIAERAAKRRLFPHVTTLLSPFDPVVWDRARAYDLFAFHYRIEVYTPGRLRKFGYFTLPILRKDKLVGRVDAKAHRKDGRFEVRAMHLEDGVGITNELVSDIATTLEACAAWHNTPRVEVVGSDATSLTEAICAQLSKPR